MCQFLIFLLELREAGLVLLSVFQSGIEFFPTDNHCQETGRWLKRGRRLSERTERLGGGGLFSSERTQ